nr:T9SS type A sorting domain-containing protein [Cytophagales bacterium]
MKPFIKLTLLSYLIICFSSITHAASYYFSNSNGNDSRSSTQAQNPDTPWKTISKLNSFFPNLKPGDIVYFQRGETFVGTIRLSASGTSSNPIRISAYGSGANPVITSLVEVDGWKSLGNGRFESTSTFSPSEVSIVVLNDQVQERGRFPNASDVNGGYLTINSVSGTRTISSNNLPSSPNFTGGEAVIRKVQWIVDRHPIVSHSGSTIEYGGTSNFPPVVNWGFFIQDHINTLDQYGEWFYNRSNKRLNVFFGSSNPSSQKTFLATLDHLLTKTSGSSNIVIENLHFRGANKDAINISGGSGIRFSNNEIEFSGENGFYVTSIPGIELNNNKVSYSMNTGIYLRFGNQGAKVTNNRVENSFVFQGGGQSGDNNGVGIFAASDGTIVENNEVINTGYNGIHFNGNGTKIKNNLVDHYCLVKNDGGGIYSFGGQSGTVYRDREINGNVILNGDATNFGTPLATSWSSKPHASGIFLDDNVSGVNVFNNTVAHTKYTGIKIANARDLIVNNNTFYDTDIHVLLGNSGNGGDTRNVIITNNILFSKESDQSAYAVRSSKDDIAQFGTFDRNFFVRPLGDNHSITTTYTRDGKRINETLNLERWQKLYNEDPNSSLFAGNVIPFEVIQTKGTSKYPNGTFESNFNGINCSDCQLSRVTGVLTGNALQVNSPGSSSARVAVGSIKANQNYILSFKAKASKKGYLRAFLRFAGTPWQQISSSTAVELGTSISEHKILLKSPINVSDAVVMLVSDEGNWTYWLDDLELKEADVNVTKPEEVFLFEYNASKSTKTIPLNGTYLDGKNRTLSSKVDLAPYSSIVLVKIDGKIDPVVNTPPSVRLTSPSDKSFFNVGSNITLTAEASSETSTIARVNFFHESKLIGAATSAPYTINWQPTAGTYLVRAEAIDANGSSSLTPQVTVTVSEITSDPVEVTPTPPPGTEPVNPSAIAVKIGSTSEISYNGITFIPISRSNFTSSGFKQSVRTAASNEPLFQSGGFDTKMTFNLPVANGSYTVITYHHELYFGVSGPTATEGQRVFDIAVEGEIVKKDLDMFKEFGNKESFLTFPDISVTDGVLSIELTASENNALISAIQVIPNLPEIADPAFSLFINTGSRVALTHEGNSFVSDYNPSYFSSSNFNENTESSSIPLFQTHRFAKTLHYTIPVPNGEYRVVTFHKENYFGTVVPAQKGQRIFDIILEGQIVKEDLDMFVETNNRETTLSFENILVTDGFLNITLAASANNGIISGIGIVSMEEAIINEPTGISQFIKTGSKETMSFDGYEFITEFVGDYYSDRSNFSEFEGASTEKLFQSHRFAPTLTYTIPIPNGEYTVLTFHNEIYFGKQVSTTGPGRRVFDIFIEGELKKDNLDLFVESNNNPLRLSFTDIRVSDGVLNIDMIASRNSATISAIAIISQSDVKFYSMSNLRQLTDSTSGVILSEPEIGHVSPSEIKIYPNPASNQVTLEIPTEIGNFDIQLLNTSGQLIQSFPSESVSSGSGRYEIPVYQLKKGLYIISIMTDNQALIRHKLLVNP